MFRPTLAALLAGLALLPQPLSSAGAPQQVDLKLVLAVDVSGSIDDDELQLERQGTADAFHGTGSCSRHSEWLARSHRGCDGRFFERSLQ